MAAARLNLLVVCFDTLRRDAVASALARTPHLDAFAEQAVVYGNAWAEGLPTVPFRRAAHTGRRSYPWRHDVGDRGSYPNLLGWHAIPESDMTLAEYLLQRGYATGLISDLWHMFKATMNFVRGFVSWDFIRGQEGDTYTLAREGLQDPSPFGGRRVGPSGYLYQTRERGRDEDYFAAQVFDRAGQWLEGMRGASPWFLWVDSFTPHEFWDPPVRFADAYCPGEGLQDRIVPQSLNPGPGRPPAEPRDIERTAALYKGYVTFADERFGRMLARAERAGQLRDTVVVVLSDHGTELWDQGQFGKSAARLHAYNTQINWMVRHPDLSTRHDVDAFVQNHDLVPTLLHLLGVPHPPLDGAVVWPFAPQAALGRDHVLTGWEGHVSVRDRRWNLLLQSQDLTVAPRLYDLEADPREERDVAAAQPEAVARQVARLEALLGAPLPARYGHRTSRWPVPTTGALREIRRQRAAAGELWQGSNLI